MEEFCFTASRDTQTLVLFIVSGRSFYINIYFFEAGQGKAKLNNVSFIIPYTEFHQRYVQFYRIVSPLAHHV